MMVLYFLSFVLARECIVRYSIVEEVIIIVYNIFTELYIPGENTIQVHTVVKSIEIIMQLC